MSGCTDFADESTRLAIPFARHIHYGVSGPYPVVVKMIEDTCPTTAANTFVGGRHIDYTHPSPPPPPLPKMADALACCYDYDPRPRVRTDCYAPGFTQRLVMVVTDRGNCHKIYAKSLLNYDAISGCWFGSVTLELGSLSFMLCCGVDFFGVPTFTLTWSGCDPLTGSSSLTCSPQCVDPLLVQFFLNGLDDCCNCFHTNQDSSIAITITGNCHAVQKGRHIHYTSGKYVSGVYYSGLPVVANSNDCASSLVRLPCCQPNCGLVAVVTSLDGCACMAGTYILSFVGPDPNAHWNGGTAGGLSPPCGFSIDIICEEVVGTLCAKLTLTVSCLSSEPPNPPQTAVIYVSTVYNLDVTFLIAMSSTNCCSGHISIRVMR